MAADTPDSRHLYDPCDDPGFTACHVSYWIWEIAPPVLLFVGTFGNIFSIILLSRKGMRKYSTTVYLLFLAVSDLTMLISSCLRETLLFVYKLDLFTISNYHCTILYWLMYTSGLCSSWFLVLLTFERVLFIKAPIFARQNITRKTAIVACTCVVLVGSVLNIHYFIGQRIQRIVMDTNSTRFQPEENCMPVGEAYAEFLTRIWPMLITFLLNGAPFLLIFIGNVVLLYELRKRKESQVNSSRSGLDKNGQATRILFILSAFFLVTVTPFVTFLALKPIVYKYPDDRGFAELQLIYLLLKLLFWCNYTFNFFLYFVSGTLFKREWLALVAEIKAKLRCCPAVDRNSDALNTEASISNINLDLR